MEVAYLRRVEQRFASTRSGTAVPVSTSVEIH
jgi:hypothetical protein